MRADIDASGKLTITPESEVELYALRRWTEESQSGCVHYRCSPQDWPDIVREMQAMGLIQGYDGSNEAAKS